jgi:flagellar basal body-associated protein FliL
MSEEATAAEAPKKKKGKLPIIIVLALVLGAGGFFGMKARGGEKKEKPAIKLGKVAPLEEFLVNLKEPESYVRTTISLQFDDKFEVAKLEECKDAIRDAVILKLSSKGINDVRTLEAKQALKRELAQAINVVLNAEKEEKEAHDKKDAKDEKQAAEAPKDEKKDAKPAEHKDWDSQTGPVLKVLFTNFATQ